MSKFDNWQVFEKITKTEINQETKEKLQQYFEFLVTENQKYNLTTILEENDVYLKHFLDSIIFTKDFQLTNQKICDIGTGAGFPGVVLKIFFPDLEVHLVESNNKKIYFLNELIKKLDLKNIFTHYTRAEEFSNTNSEKFDIVISRAVSELNVLLELGAQVLKLNGHFICLKGPRAEEEIKNLNKHESKIGLKFKSQFNENDDFLGVRINLIYEKVAKTPKEYPRQYAQIKKKPLGK